MRRLALSMGFLFIQLMALERGAHAFQETRSGVSVGVGLEQNIDGSITQSTDPDGTTYRSGHFDAKALANVGDVAFGSTVAWAPDILGNGRLLVGGRLGWQPTVGTTRFQILASSGIHRFTNTGGGLFATSTPNLVTTQFVGAEIGLTRSFFRDGLLEYGLGLHVRHDLETATVTRQESTFNIFGAGDQPPPPPTQINVGGTMIGAALTIGFRVEARRPSTTTD